MQILKSRLQTRSGEFQANVRSMEALVATMRERISRQAEGGGQTAMRRHLERGKLPARERVRRILDSGTPFLELSQVAGYGLYEGDAPCGGIITGIGRVQGRAWMFIAHDATVKGGTYFPATIRKHVRAQEIALENHLPCMYLVDSGGANLPLQDEVFPDRDHFGRSFYNQSRMSALGIAQVAIVFGSCTAGGAYVPAMSDEVVMVQGQSSVFLGGPPLVQAATGEVVSVEELGGADMHCRVSGLSDHLAIDEDHACRIARQIATRMPADAPVQAGPGWQVPEPPLYDPEEILGLVPDNPRQPWDIRELILRLVDGSRLDEFKANYGTSLITGFAHLWGFPVGILANNGILFPESSLKAAHFIELCCMRSVPLVFLQNITGFMVGKKYEESGLAKDGAKMIHAVSNAGVPKLTVIVGNSYGAGNYAMCGRAFAPRFLWRWPNSSLQVMGTEQAVSVLSDVRRAKLERSGHHWDERDQAQFREHMTRHFEEQGSPWYGGARLWDDGMIDPRDTRDVLGLCLGVTQRAPRQESRFGIFRM